MVFLHRIEPSQGPPLSLRELCDSLKRSLAAQVGRNATLTTQPARVQISVCASTLYQPSPLSSYQARCVKCFDQRGANLKICSALGRPAPVRFNKGSPIAHRTRLLVTALACVSGLCAAVRALPFRTPLAFALTLKRLCCLPTHPTPSALPLPPTLPHGVRVQRDPVMRGHGAGRHPRAAAAAVVRARRPLVWAGAHPPGQRRVYAHQDCAAALQLWCAIGWVVAPPLPRPPHIRGGAGGALWSSRHSLRPVPTPHLSPPLPPSHPRPPQTPSPPLKRRASTRKRPR